MPFQKGIAKIGGRKKGVKNKKTLQVEAIFEAHNYNPVESLLALIPQIIDKKDRARIHLELMQYIYPKRKEMPEPENEIEVYSVEEKKKLLEQAKKEMIKLEQELVKNE